MYPSIRNRIISGLALLAVLSACGAPDKQELLDEARASFAVGDESTAMIQLKNLLRLDPNDRDGRLLRAEVALAMEDGETAEKDLLRAEQLGIDRGQIVVMLGQSMMIQGAFDRVVAEIHSGAAPDKASRIEVLLLRGDAYLGLANPDRARRSFLDAMDMAPGLPAAMVGLGRAALASGDIATALTEVGRAVSAGPELPAVWLANGQVQLAAGNADEAKESFRRALALKPAVRLKRDDYATLNGLFHAHLALNELDDARAVAEQALQAGKGHPLAHYLLGQYAMRTGNVADAEDHLLKTLAGYPNHLGALSLMGSLSLEKGQLKDAETYLRQANVLDRDNPQIRMQLAQTMLQLRQADDALDMLAPLIREMGDVPELLALAGRATAASKDRSQWLGYFEQAAAADPADLKWQFELATAYLTERMPDKSVAVLQRIPDSAETSDRRDLMLVEALGQAGQLDAALQVANRLLSRHPGDLAIQVVLGRLYLYADNPDAARSHIDNVLSVEPDNIPALMALALVELRVEKPDEAEGLFRRVYDMRPDYLPAVSALVALAQSRGETDEAVAWLEAARLTNPRAVMPRVGLVALYLLQGDVGAAYRLAQEAVALEPEDPRSLTALGITQIQREEYEQAIETLGDAAMQAPDSGLIQFELSKAYVAYGNPGAARRALKRSITLAPWRADYAVAAARLELSLDNADEAGQIAATLISSRPDDPVGYLLLGKALMLQDQPVEADNSFARAVELGQSEELVIERYEALDSAGNARAPVVLREWLDDHPQDWRVRALLAQSHHRSGKTALAIGEYERVLADDPENIAVMNNLAWLYLESDPPRALALAEQAHRLRPHVGTVTDTLGWILVKQGQLERSLIVLRQAIQQAPSSAEIRYHLAVALVASGETEEARLLLTELVNSNESFAGASEARALLRDL